MNQPIICACILSALLVQFGAFAYEKAMTVYIDAGRQDCFFENVKVGETIDIEYQVTDGGHGDLDISFTLSDPNGLFIVSDFKKPENVHRHDVGKAGDYRFCFDNTFSTFNRKTVFFELIVEREGEERSWEDALDGLTPIEYYEMKVQDILDYIGRIRMQVTKARQIQDILRSHEARDRNLAENNYIIINAWSMFQIVTMVGVGILQVYMLRSIFETNSPLRGFWQKLGI